jgi:ABC-2 type transport system ATP-binding protein
MVAVEVENLVKEYTKVVKEPGLANSLRSLIRPKKEIFQAVKGVSFRAEEGELIGFLGPNGAGKTTTLKILSGILHATSGQVRVMGRDPGRRENEFKRQISLVMGNRQQLWWDLPAMDSFVVLKELYGVSDADYKRKLDRLLPELDLEGKVTTQVRKMSLGERMKCELVAALLYSPRVVFLDEPTIGLDVTSQQRIRAFLKEYQKESGCTILLTSHYMQDVEELCDRVVVINEGQIVYDGGISALADSHSQEKRLRLSFAHDISRDDLPQRAEVREFDGMSAVLAVEKQAIAPVTSDLLSCLPVVDINVEDPPIEEVITALFGRSGSSVSRETSIG